MMAGFALAVSLASVALVAVLVLDQRENPGNPLIARLAGMDAPAPDPVPIPAPAPAPEPPDPPAPAPAPDPVPAPAPAPDPAPAPAQVIAPAPGLILIQPEEPKMPEGDPVVLDRLPARLMCGDLAIELLRAKVARVEVYNLNNITTNTLTRENYLAFQVRITNTSANRIVAYGGDFWSQVTDNHGNRYRSYMKANPVRPMVNPLKRQSVRPGESISGLVVFVAPIPNISHVTLAMPGEALDCPDGLAIQVPARLIER